MKVRIGFEIEIECQQPTPMLLALYPHPSSEGRILGSDCVRAKSGAEPEEFSDAFGNRCGRLLAPAGRTSIWSDCIAEINRTPDRFNWNARQHEVMDLPTETLPYLLSSRYCESDELAEEAWPLFEGFPAGWARVQAIANWVHNHVMFDYRFGRATKTAVDVFRERTGVCRDYAHLFIAFCRAMNIPARYASGYLGDIGVPPTGPGDFSAWAEVFLEGEWYTFDPRHNCPRIGRVLMVRGRDAADVAMMTTFGSHALLSMKVWTDEIECSDPPEDITAILGTRPDSSGAILEQSSGRLGV